MSRLSPNARCPCGRPSKFKQCCQRYHRGLRPSTPEELMRSRYAAYAASEVDYLIATTHPDSPYVEADVRAWRESLREHCRQTTFEHLEVLEAWVEPDGQRGQVTFRATLTQGGQDVGFTERSLFLLHDGRWKYVSGDFLES